MIETYWVAVRVDLRSDPDDWQEGFTDAATMLRHEIETQLRHLSGVVSVQVSVGPKNWDLGTPWFESPKS